MEKDLALQASASLITLLSSIHAAVRRRTNSGGYCKMRIAMGAYRDEKSQFKKLKCMGPPAAKNTREATARTVGTNNNHNLTSSTLTARRSCSINLFRSGSISGMAVRT